MPRARLTGGRAWGRGLVRRWSAAPRRPLSDLARRTPPRARKPRADGCDTPALAAGVALVLAAVLGLPPAVARLRLGVDLAVLFAAVRRFTPLRLAADRGEARLTARFLVLRDLAVFFLAFLAFFTSLRHSFLSPPPPPPPPPLLSLELGVELEL